MRPFVEWVARTSDENGTYTSTAAVYNLSSESFFLRCYEPDNELVRTGMLERTAKLKEEATLAKKLERSFPCPGLLGGLPLLIDRGLGFPKFDAASFTRAPDNVGDDLHVKTLLPLFYGDPAERENYKRYLLSEAKVYQDVLGDHSCTHIVRYHGCVVEKGLIVGLALDKLDQDLTGRCHQPDIPLDVGRVIAQITEALNYLHKLGYCHNDVNPDNVMLTTNDEAVLVDFDSCQPKGEPLDKWPLAGYKPAESVRSCEENDWHGLNKVKEHLLTVFRAVPDGDHGPPLCSA